MGVKIIWAADPNIQTTLQVVHSPVVEKLPVADKYLPPYHSYLAKVHNSGQFPVVDKKSRIYIKFCCLHFYNNLLFTDMHTLKSLIQTMKLRIEVIQFSA